MTSYFKHHIFFCLNARKNGEDCCMRKGAESAFDYMKSKVKALGLSGQHQIRINRSGCLDRCGLGPVMVVYPEAVWYTFVDNEDIDEVIESHLVKGIIVQRLVV